MFVDRCFVVFIYFKWLFHAVVDYILLIMKIPMSERAFLLNNSKLVIGQRRKRNPLLRRKVPPIPTAAHWGYGHLPPCAKILVLGVLCGLISITTPFWHPWRLTYLVRQLTVCGIFVAEKTALPFMTTFLKEQVYQVIFVLISLKHLNSLMQRSLTY